MNENIQIFHSKTKPAQHLQRNLITTIIFFFLEDKYGYREEQTL